MFWGHTYLSKEGRLAEDPYTISPANHCSSYTQDLLKVGYLLNFCLLANGVYFQFDIEAEPELPSLLLKKLSLEKNVDRIVVERL